MLHKVRVQASRFDVDMPQSFGQPMTQDERLVVEKEIGEQNAAKKAATAQLVLEEASKRAERKAEKQAVKGTNCG